MDLGRSGFDAALRDCGAEGFARLERETGHPGKTERSEGLAGRTGRVSQLVGDGSL